MSYRFFHILLAKAKSRSPVFLFLFLLLSSILPAFLGPFVFECPSAPLTSLSFALSHGMHRFQFQKPSLAHTSESSLDPLPLEYPFSVPPFATLPFSATIVMTENRSPHGLIVVLPNKRWIIFSLTFFAFFPLLWQLVRYLSLPIATITQNTRSRFSYCCPVWTPPIFPPPFSF